MADSVDDATGTRGPDYGEIERLSSCAGILTQQMYRSNDQGAFFFRTASELKPEHIRNQTVYINTLLDYYLDSISYYLLRAKLSPDRLKMLSFRDTFEYMAQLFHGWPVRSRRMNDIEW